MHKISCLEPCAFSYTFVVKQAPNFGLNFGQTLYREVSNKPVVMGR